jgi:hypothetical protein
MVETDDTIRLPGKENKKKVQAPVKVVVQSKTDEKEKELNYTVGKKNYLCFRI